VATVYYGRTVVELPPMMPAHTYGESPSTPQQQVLFAGDIAFSYVARTPASGASAGAARLDPLIIPGC